MYAVNVVMDDRCRIAPAILSCYFTIFPVFRKDTGNMKKAADPLPICCLLFVIFMTVYIMPLTLLLSFQIALCGKLRHIRQIIGVEIALDSEIVEGQTAQRIIAAKVIHAAHDSKEL